MWFKELSDHIGFVNPVVEVRPLLQQHYEKLGRKISNAVYSMLHYGYVLSLEQIGPGAKFPDQPKNLRVVESDGNGPIALHEVSLNKDKPELMQTFLDLEYISDFERAVSNIGLHEKDETKGEIRYLSVPALNVEAVWLHFEDDKNDRFGLTRKFNVTEGQVYSGAKFVSLLDELKSKQGKIKGEMGA